MSCVAACPAAGALDLTIGARRRRVAVPAWAVATSVAVLFCGIVLYARAHSYWHTALPDDVYFDVIPRASEFVHPR
jgi:hypothetical protein